MCCSSGTTICTHALNLRTRRLEGDAELVQQGVASWLGSAAAVDTSRGGFRAGTPETMFAVRSMEGGRRVRGITQIAVSRDGSRIYYQQPVQQPDSEVIHIRMGWAR